MERWSWRPDGRPLEVETGEETTELGVETQAETTGLERLLRWRPQDWWRSTRDTMQCWEELE